MSVRRSPHRQLPGLLGRVAVALAPKVTGALLRVDLPEASAEQRAAAVAHVRGAVLGMPDLLRCGVAVAAVGYLVARRVLGPRVDRLNLPVVAEFVRLTRGLGLAGAVERERR
ncbi:hypothetical protein N8J89_00810 [Crossiella sp. CA-258035]|uniref:hypothetical protein n=1 Tax=Crossiella sp. CA-258035 TaxID=2981138 RepID=UPI0024BCF8AA|nr:hypothetical protein [Crossiella sp. CA-258035]WHT19669.1 hypothetical protein N8J89_00810 [Crossiella sp. CA-258035]